MTGKKIASMLLAVLLIFVGFLAGLLVGRMTTGNMYLYSSERGNSAAVSSESIDPTETVQFIDPTVPHEINKKTRLDLNVVTKEELMEIPGIGEVLAQRILDFRQQHGSFYSIDELAEVEGIGEKRLEDLRKYLYVEDKR